MANARPYQLNGIYIRVKYSIIRNCDVQVSEKERERNCFFLSLLCGLHYQCDIVTSQ